MSSEIFQAIEQVGREKGIEVDIIVEAVEDAYAAAAKKFYRTKEDIGARFDRDSGALEVFARKRIMSEVTNPDLEISNKEAKKMKLAASEEGFVEIPKPRDELMQLGRIAAQAAKQIIFQKVREAERDNIYKEYIGRVGEMINGVVKRFERGNIIIDLGRTEAVLPKKEQSRAERYSQGDRIRAVIVEVDHNAKGPQVIISRTDERLLTKLFEMEVPEIYDGTVIIERAVRDPGDRAKVAVRSKDRDVDPVGACVGMKGSRVQSIIRELRGEKIDIVQFSEDISTFVNNALNPAKINRVQIRDPEDKALEVIVDDEQLSLAIGKRGQNVRLASRLSGWKIDIKSELDKKREVETEMERIARNTREIESLEGIGAKNIQKIAEAGFRSVEEIIFAGVKGLTKLQGVGPKTAEKILSAAQQMLDTRPEREEEERLRREEEAAAEAALLAEQEAAQELLMEPQESAAAEEHAIEAEGEPLPTQEPGGAADVPIADVADSGSETEVEEEVELEPPEQLAEPGELEVEQPESGSQAEQLETEPDAASAIGGIESEGAGTASSGGPAAGEEDRELDAGETASDDRREDS